MPAGGHYRKLVLDPRRRERWCMDGLGAVPDYARGAKVLVIDDDALVRRALSRLLEDEGYGVLMAEDGRQGVALFLREQPDIVITDLIMPEQQGIDTIAEMLRARPGAKIIAMSGSGRIGSRDLLETAQVFGAADVVMKPFEPDDLICRVRRCSLLMSYERPTAE
jgi:two-component system, chemotaxis family, chemotaxis protein CheY